MNSMAGSPRAPRFDEAAIKRGAASVRHGGSGSGSVRRLSAVLAMLVGAIAGALLLKASVFAPLGLAAVLAIATWLVYVPAAVRLGSNPK
jgi:uncharacterized membrane protein YoaK (UPF0700 family)